MAGKRLRGRKKSRGLNNITQRMKRNYGGHKGASHYGMHPHIFWDAAKGVPWEKEGWDA